MKKLIFLLLLPVFAWGQPYRGLMVKTNGELASPTNFWDVNASSILDALDLSSDSVTTNDARRLQFTNPTNQFIGVFTGNGNGLTNLSLVAILEAFPSGVSNYDTRALSFTNPANQLVGVFSGNGANLTNLPIPSGLLSNYYVLPVVLNDSLSLSNGNIGFTNYGGTATLYMSSPNGGGLGSIAFNGAYTFAGSGGIQANQFVGSGAGLTGIPYSALPSNLLTNGYTPDATFAAGVSATNFATTNGLNWLEFRNGTIRGSNSTASAVVSAASLAISNNIFMPNLTIYMGVDANQGTFGQSLVRLSDTAMVGFRDKSYFSAGPVEGTYWFTPSDDETLPTKFIFGGGDRFSSRGAWAAGSNNLPMITAATNVSPLFIFGNAAGATNATVAVSNLFIKGTGYPLPTSGELRFNYGSRIQWGTTGGALGGYIQDANNNLKLGLEVPPYLFMDLNSTRLNLYSNFVSGAQIQSTNKFVANTYAMVDGSRTTAGNVFEYKTNNSTVFNVDTTGAVVAARFAGQFRGAWYANNNANAGWDLLSSSPPWLKTVDPSGSPTPSILSSNGLFSGWVGITNSGIYFSQLTAIPTNAILASSSGNTNWTLCNLTNTIGGGGPTFVATNIATAGSFLLARPALTVTTYP